MLMLMLMLLLMCGGKCDNDFDKLFFLHLHRGGSRTAVTSKIELFVKYETAVYGLMEPNKYLEVYVACNNMLALSNKLHINESSFILI